MNKSYKDLRWAVLVPAYNESLTILLLLNNILEFKPTQLIVVNDASIDNTVEIIDMLPIVLLNNVKNTGKAGSLWKGFEKAIDLNMDVVITIDGDGQHDPGNIPELIEKYLQNNNKIIIGSRKKNPQSQPFARYFANKFANFWVSWAAGYRISDSQSGYRLYPVSLLKNIGLLKQSQGFVFESEVLIEAAWQNYYSEAVEIEAIYPEKRRASHFKPFKDIMNITKMVASRLFEKKMNLAGLYSVMTNKKPFSDGVLR